MKKSEIKLGGLYKARVSDKIVTVRVEEIYTRDGHGYTRDGTSYRCTNLSTGRSVTFRSAAKFRGPAQMGVDHA